MSFSSYYFNDIMKLKTVFNIVGDYLMRRLAPAVFDVGVFDGVLIWHDITSDTDRNLAA